MEPFIANGLASVNGCQFFDECMIMPIDIQTDDENWKALYWLYKVERTLGAGRTN